MTEKEKMMAGQWYDANNDRDLIAERLRVKDLCFDFNHTRPSDVSTRAALLKKILPHVDVSTVEILGVEPLSVDLIR